MGRRLDEETPSFGVVLTDGYVPWHDSEAWPLEVLVVTLGSLPERHLGYDAMNLDSKTYIFQ